MSDQEFNEKFEIIKAEDGFNYDGFALCRLKENGDIVIVYNYDMGYGYPYVSLGYLLDIDRAKALEIYYRAIGNMITSCRPYNDKLADILAEVNK